MPRQNRPWSTKERALPSFFVCRSEKLCIQCVRRLHSQMTAGFFASCWWSSNRYYRSQFHHCPSPFAKPYKASHALIIATNGLPTGNTTIMLHTISKVQPRSCRSSYSIWLQDANFAAGTNGHSPRRRSISYLLAPAIPTMPLLTSECFSSEVSEDYLAGLQINLCCLARAWTLNYRLRDGLGRETQLWIWACR